LGEPHLCTSKVPCVFVELANLNEKVLIEYLMKRHDTAERRLAGEPFPWTADVRLQAGRYMNIHRRLDPTSIFLANVLEGLPFPLRLFNAALFRMVGTIDFWRECVINPIQQWADELWDSILQRVLLRVASGWNPFTRAYNHPRHSQGATEGNVIEVFNNLHTALSQLWKKMDAIEASFSARRSWKDLHKALVNNVHFLGAFYAKEVCLDGLEESMDVVDMHTWSPVCTGGRKGLNICFQRPREWGVRFRSAAAVRLWEQECRVVQARMLYIYTYIHLYIYIYISADASKASSVLERENHRIIHSIPFHSIPKVPFHSLPFPSLPFPSLPFPSIPFHSIPFHSLPFDSLRFPSSFDLVMQPSSLRAK
jgi:hypothetical protein